ncbi:MAG: WD40 repeat domain-containing protein, partial [Bacteroidota bacterium]|nr:WD40 repeat domain-containing protein [Bacteroidota bacterium]
MRSAQLSVSHRTGYLALLSLLALGALTAGCSQSTTLTTEPSITQTSHVHIDISGSFSGSMCGRNVVAFSPDGSKIALFPSYCTPVVIFDVSAGKPLETDWPFSSEPMGNISLQFSRDGNTFLAYGQRSGIAGEGANVSCWKSDGTSLGGLNSNHSNYIYSATLTPDGASVIIADVSGVYKYDIASRTITARFAVPGSVKVDGVTANGTRLVVSSSDTVYIWDMASNRAVSSFKILSVREGETGILSPDGAIIAFTYPSLNFYSLTSGTAINPAPIIGYNFVGIHPDNARFLAWHTGQGNGPGLFSIS